MWMTFALRSHELLVYWIDWRKQFPEEFALCHDPTVYLILQYYLEKLCSILIKQIVLQRRAIRIINNVPPLSNTDLLFKKFKIISVADINKLQVAVFMYSYHSNLLPLSFKNLYTFNYAIHSHKTPLFKYNFSRTTVKFTGAKNWNEMPNKIKNSKTLNQK